MGSITLAAFNLSHEPAASLTPSWLAWKVVATGDDVDPGSHPTIINRGLGEYSVEDPAAGECGVIDLGAAASPRYVFVGPSEGAVLVAFTSSGVPLEGLTPTWHTHRNSSGDDITPQATFTDLGSGMYRINDLSSAVEGLVDFGEGFPRFQFVGPEILVEDLEAPSVSNLVPATGTTISRLQEIEFDVTDSRDLSLILVAVKFVKFSGITELAWDGLQAVGLYTATVTAITDGYHFVISRDKGWPASPTIRVFAVDSFGNEA